MDKIERITRLLAVVCALVTLSACPGKSSSKGDNGHAVPTSAMEIHMSVERTYSTVNVSEIVARVEVELDDSRTDQASKGPNGELVKPKIQLDGGDYLQACTADRCQNLTMQKGIFLGPDLLFYYAELPVVEGTPYRVSLLRPAGRVSAPSTTATLPLASVLVEPIDDQHVSDGEFVTASWSPIDPAAIAVIDGWINCSFGPPAATRSWTFPTVVDESRSGFVQLSVDDMLAGVLADRPSSPAPKAPVTGCEMYVYGELEHRGVADAAFATGEALGIHRLPYRRQVYTPSK